MSKTSPIIVRNKGDFAKTEKFFKRNRKQRLMNVLNRLGQRGVDALAAATPVDTGKTAASWRYVIEADENERISIQWINDNEAPNGDNIVTLLIRGHGTRNGHYYRAADFVTPAISPILNDIINEVWAEVTK